MLTNAFTILNGKKAITNSQLTGSSRIPIWALTPRVISRISIFIVSKRFISLIISVSNLEWFYDCKNSAEMCNCKLMLTYCQYPLTAWQAYGLVIIKWSGKTQIIFDWCDRDGFLKIKLKSLQLRKTSNSTVNTFCLW